MIKRKEVSPILIQFRFRNHSEVRIHRYTCLQNQRCVICRRLIRLISNSVMHTPNIKIFNISCSLFGNLINQSSPSRKDCKSNVTHNRNKEVKTPIKKASIRLIRKSNIDKNLKSTEGVQKKKEKFISNENNQLRKITQTLSKFTNNRLYETNLQKSKQKNKPELKNENKVILKTHRRSLVPKITLNLLTPFDSTPKDKDHKIKLKEKRVNVFSTDIFEKSLRPVASISCVKHLRPKFRYVVRCYRSCLSKLLFPKSPTKISKFREAMSKLVSSLSKEESELISSFFLDLSPDTKVGVISDAKKSEIIHKILEFSEEEKYGDCITFDEIDQAIKLDAFKSPDNCTKFANDLEDISKCCWPSPLDIVEIISANRMNIDSIEVISYLMQDYSNPSFISQSSISKFAKYIQSCVSDSQTNRNCRLNKNTEDFITKLKKKTCNKSHKEYRNISEIAKNVFIRLAEFI